MSTAIALDAIAAVTSRASRVPRRRQRTVGRGLTGRNLLQERPYFLLVVVAAWIDGDIPVAARFIDQRPQPDRERRQPLLVLFEERLGEARAQRVQRLLAPIGELQGNDAVLVDVYTGEVLSAYYGVFW